MGRKLISLLYIITLWLFLGRFGHITQIEAVRYINPPPQGFYNNFLTNKNIEMKIWLIVNGLTTNL